MVAVVTLVLVLLMADGRVTPQTRQMESIIECKLAEAEAHAIAAQSFDVLDVGTLCVESKFDPAVKPHA